MMVSNLKYMFLYFFVFTPLSKYVFSVQNVYIIVLERLFLTLEMQVDCCIFTRWAASLMLFIMFVKFLWCKVLWTPNCTGLHMQRCSVSVFLLLEGLLEGDVRFEDGLVCHVWRRSFWVSLTVLSCIRCSCSVFFCYFLADFLVNFRDFHFPQYPEHSQKTWQLGEIFCLKLPTWRYLLDGKQNVFKKQKEKGSPVALTKGFGDYDDDWESNQCITPCSSAVHVHIVSEPLSGVHIFVIQPVFLGVNPLKFGVFNSAQSDDLTLQCSTNAYVIPITSDINNFNICLLSLLDHIYELKC